MEYERELYAERLRRKSQAEALAAGTAQWTDQLDMRVRVRLGLAWEDATRGMETAHRDFTVAFVEGRTLRSIGLTIGLGAMRSSSNTATNEQLLSLLEAEHEALDALMTKSRSFASPRGGGGGGWGFDAAAALEEFQRDVNRIFEAHLIGLHLHHNSRLVPVDSHEMHNAVVAPTLYLLHSQPRFAGAEAAYQNALKELRNRDPGDAITDAATALQEVLKSVGCTGGALGDLLTSARKRGILTGADTPLTEAIGKTVNWVAAKRNQGEAHVGDHDMNMSDAWMMVHVVGALTIRLSETDQPDR